MKLFTTLAFVAGLALLTVLIAYAGFQSVGEAVEEAGWGVALVVLVRGGEITGATWSWWVLFPPTLRPRFTTSTLVRWIRDSINVLLPVAMIGGEIAGTRLLMFFGVEGSLAAASIVAEVMIMVVTHLLFTMAGLLTLVALGGGGRLVQDIMVGLLIAVPVVGGLYLAQRRGAYRSLAHLLRRFPGNQHLLRLGTADKFYGWLEAIYRARKRVFIGGLIHMGVWFLGAAEVWIALGFMGWPVTYAEALVIESLGQAVKSAAFAVPGALGVQEGGLVALCTIFGVPIATALALSLVKRVADVSLGVPGLIAWQVLEGRRALGLR